MATTLRWTRVGTRLVVEGRQFVGPRRWFVGPGGCVSAILVHAQCRQRFFGRRQSRVVLVCSCHNTRQSRRCRNPQDSTAHFVAPKMTVPIVRNVTVFFGALVATNVVIVAVVPIESKRL